MKKRGKIFLHIGYNKTGTTAIQRVFYYNITALDKKGILYPTKCMDKRKPKPYAHHTLAESILFKINKNLPYYVKTKFYKKYSVEY